MTTLLVGQLAVAAVALVVALALYREAHVLRARVRLAGQHAPDGPEVGDVAPPPFRRKDAEVVFLQESCPSTPEVLRRLRLFPPTPTALSVVLVPPAEDDRPRGEDGEDPARSARALADALPQSLFVYRDEEAAAAAGAAGFGFGPLYVRVRDGLVNAKHLVGDPDELRRLLGLREAAGGDPGTAEAAPAAVAPAAPRRRERPRTAEGSRP